MTRRLVAAVRTVRDTWHDVRHEHFVHLGPIYVSTTKRHWQSGKNAFDIGREWERAQQLEAGAR